MMQWLQRGKSLKHAIFSLDESLLLLAIMQNEKLVLFDSFVLETANADTIYAALRNMVDKYYLVGCQTSLVLSDAYYQLLMTDQLSVPEEEMTSALRWKMKGLLDMPINDAALDTFIVPSHGMGQKRKKVFVVAAEKAFLNQCVAAFEKALIPLSHIAIELLSLKNLVTSEVAAKQTQLLISLSKSQCVLTIIYDKNIYLVRKPKIDSITFENTEDNGLYEQLLLEIQRSTDYCLSELKLPAPKEVVLSSAFLMQGTMVAYLAKNLEQQIKCIDLNELVNTDKLIPLKHQKALYLNIGYGLKDGAAELTTAQMNEGAIDATAS